MTMSHSQCQDRGISTHITTGVHLAAHRLQNSAVGLVLLILCSSFAGCAWYQSKVAYRNRNSAEVVKQQTSPFKKPSNSLGTGIAGRPVPPAALLFAPPIDPFADVAPVSKEDRAKPKAAPFAESVGQKPTTSPPAKPSENARAEFVLQEVPERLPPPFGQPVRDGAGYFFKVSDEENPVEPPLSEPTSDAIVLIGRDGEPPSELKASIGSTIRIGNKSPSIESPRVPPIEEEGDLSQTPIRKPTLETYHAKIRQFQWTGATSQSKKLPPSGRSELFQHPSVTSENGTTNQSFDTRWSSKFQLQPIRP
jgi:hypothetical protein